MDRSATHLTAHELAQGLADVRDSPRDVGALIAIFIRPQENQRQSLAEALLAPETGIAGDRWVREHWQRLPNGSSDPQSQITFFLDLCTWPSRYL